MHCQQWSCALHYYRIVHRYKRYAQPIAARDHDHRISAKCCWVAASRQGCGIADGFGSGLRSRVQLQSSRRSG
eukprot:3712-Heterococcus_DN1.PRE.3